MPSSNRHLLASWPFNAALGLYASVVIAAAMRLATLFGVRPSAGIGILLAVPVGVSIWRRSHPGGNERREVGYIVVLTALTIALSVIVVRAWFEAGMDVRHSEDIRSAELKEVIRRDPAFRDVELFVSGKHLFWFRGRVSSEADVQRLRALAARYDLHVGQKLDVRGPAKREEADKRADKQEEARHPKRKQDTHP